MNKTSILSVPLLIALMLTLSFARRKDTDRLSTPDHAAVFLIRFGEDGTADLDWSGSIPALQSRIRGWQFAKGDEISGNAWKCFTRRETYWDAPYEPKLNSTSRRDKVTAKGVLLEFDELQNRHIGVVTAQGEFSFETNLGVGDPPRRFLNGRVSVAALPASAPLTSGPDADDYPSLVAARDGTLWLAYQSYTEGKGNRILVRRRSKGVWSRPETLADAGDYFRTAIAQDGAGRIWVVWAAQRDSNFDLYARSYDGKRWSPIERLTSAENSDIFHVLASDKAGNLYLAYQSARAGNFDIYLRVFNGKTWSQEMQVSMEAANDWEPALAVAPNGTVTILWDSYANGNYDVVARNYANRALGPVFPIASSGAFEARPSAVYDRRGRLWIAWEEGDWNWGKDYGTVIPESGRGLLVRRHTRVAVLDHGRLLQTADPIAHAVPEDLRQVFLHPAITIDATGNPWVLFRTRVNLPIGGGQFHEETQPYRALWRLCATSYRGGRWTPMTEFTDGYGGIDLPASTALQKDGRLGWRGRPTAVSGPPAGRAIGISTSLSFPRDRPWKKHRSSLSCRPPKTSRPLIRVRLGTSSGCAATARSGAGGRCKSFAEIFTGTRSFLGWQS